MKKSSTKPSQSHGADERDVEVLVEEVAVGLDDRQQQDGEAPHGEEVGQPRDRPLQELALAGDLDDLGLGLAGDRSAGTGRGRACPARMSRDSQWNRRAAMAKPITVTPRPRMILTGTKYSSPRGTSVAECERHLGFHKRGQRIVWRALAGVVQRQNISFPS